MIYGIKTTFEAHAYCPEPVIIRVGKYAVRVETDNLAALDLQKGLNHSVVNTITIKTSLPTADGGAPRLSTATGTRGIVFDRGKSPKRELIDMLQYLESLGSFWLGIRKMEFNGVEEFWEAESEEEKHHIEINNFSTKETRVITPEQFKKNSLVQLIEAKEILDHLKIPMAFYRTGKVEYENRNYYFAFINYFLLLEFFFAGGTSRQDMMHKNFSENVEFMKAISETLENHNVLMRAKELQPFFDKMSLSLAKPHDVALFLIKMRGQLAHQFQEDTRDKIHLLNQDSFEPIAFFAFAICQHILPFLLTKDFPKKDTNKPNS